MPIWSDGKVALEEFKRMIEEDKEQQRLPLLVIFDTDQQTSYPLDIENVTGLQHLCSSQNS